jgi:hypothetical protein
MTRLFRIEFQVWVLPWGSDGLLLLRLRLFHFIGGAWGIVILGFLNLEFFDLNALCVFSCFLFLSFFFLSLKIRGVLD